MYFCLASGSGTGYLPVKQPAQKPRRGENHESEIDDGAWRQGRYDGDLLGRAGDHARRLLVERRNQHALSEPEAVVGIHDLRIGIRHARAARRAAPAVEPVHHQLVRRVAMERLKPWNPDPEERSDPLLAQQLELVDTGPGNLGLPMSGLILRTPTDVLRVWRSDDGELPAAATDGLRAFYRQDPSRQLQLALDPDGPRSTPGHLALLWADSGAVLTRFDLVRPCGHVGRRVQVDWHVDLRERLGRPAA